MHILDLPPELLARILVTYVRDGPQLQSSGIHPSHKRYNVLFVCRRWYSIALECPEMWSVIIHPSTFSYTKAMVERSKDAPLHVECMSRGMVVDYYDMNTLNLIFSQNHRIIHLEISMFPIILNLLSSFPRPFSLPAARYIMSKPGIFGNAPANYPFSAPALRSLHAEGYSFQQLRAAGALPSTILHLTGGSDEEELRQFLEHLRNTPLLEKLVWHPPLQNSGVPHRFQVLSLEHLTTLNLTLRTPDLHFLKYISCPPGVSLTLSILRGHVFDVDMFSSTLEYAFAISGIASISGKGEEIRMARLSVQNKIDFVCWTNPCPESYSGETFPVRSDPPRLTISLLSREVPLHMVEDVRGLCGSLTTKLELGVVDTLILDNYCGEHQPLLTSLTEVLSRMLSVHALITMGWHWNSLEKFLIQSEPQMIFPRLETIHVAAAQIESHYDVSHGEPAILMGIQRLLDHRRLQASTVTDLHLWDNTVHPVPLGHDMLDILVQRNSSTAITLHHPG